MLSKKSLLIFDLDGTLFNTLGDLSVAVNFALKHFNLPEHSSEKIRSFIGNGSMKLIERSMGDFALPHKILESGVTVENVHKVYSNFYLEHCTQKTFPNPFIKEFLENNKSAKMAMLTNKPMAPAKKILEHFDLLKYFDFILCGDTSPMRKPSPQGILKILEMSKISSKEAVMIGDDTPDVMASKNANIDCITLYCGFGKVQNLSPLNPENIVQSYQELYDLLREITAR